MRRRFRLVWAVGAAAIALIALPTFALAEGGNSIGSAPAVSPGVRESGNTANGLHVFDNVSYIQGWNSFWRVKVRSGDSLRVSWSAPPGTGLHINLFAGETNDYNVGRANPLAYQGQNAEGKNLLVYRAKEAGSLVLDMRSQSLQGTAYSFVVRITHRSGAGR